MTDKNVLFEALKPFLAPLASHDEVKAIITQHVAAEIPHDFRSHRHSWRKALSLCEQMAAGNRVDFNPDDASYWAHEARAYDAAFDALDRTMYILSHSLAPKTDREIVEEVNSIARIVLRIIGTGYEAPKGHEFWKAEDPRSRKAWAYAVEIYEDVTKSEVHDALLAVEEDESANTRDILRISSGARP